MGVGWGLDPRENMSEGSEYALTPPPQKKSAFFHSKLLLDNSAIFTSSRMSKVEGKTNFSGCLKQFYGVTELTLTPGIFYDRCTPLHVMTVIPVNVILRSSTVTQKKRRSFRKFTLRNRRSVTRAFHSVVRWRLYNEVSDGGGGIPYPFPAKFLGLSKPLKLLFLDMWCSYGLLRLPRRLRIHRRLFVC